MAGDETQKGKDHQEGEKGTSAQEQIEPEDSGNIQVEEHDQEGRDSERTTGAEEGVGEPKEAEAQDTKEELLKKTAPADFAKESKETEIVKEAAASLKEDVVSKSPNQPEEAKIQEDIVLPKLEKEGEPLDLSNDEDSEDDTPVDNRPRTLSGRIIDDIKEEDEDVKDDFKMVPKDSGEIDDKDVPLMNGHLSTDEATLSSEQVQETDGISSADTQVEEDIQDEEVVMSYECHFKWSRAKVTNIDIERQIEKWEQKERQDQIRFSSHDDKHSLLMTMAFWYCMNNNFDRATDFIEQAESLCGDSPGKLHVCLANKTCILIASGHVAEGTAVKEMIPTYNELDDKGLASISGMKGDFERQLLSGSLSTSFLHYRTATKLDPTCSLWHIKAGTTLAQIRRNTHERVSEDELNFMLRAAELGAFSMQLAATLRDMALELYQNPFSDENQVQEITEQLVKVYTSLIQRSNVSAETYTECARGFASLPEPMKDVKLAEECFQKALEQCPQCCRTNLAYGQFLEHHAGRPREALDHYQTAMENGNDCQFLILPNIIRIKTELESEYDPEFEWAKYFQAAPDTSMKVKTLRSNAEYIWKVDPRRALQLYYRAASIEYQLGLSLQPRKSFPWEMQEDGVRMRVSSENKYYELEDRIGLLERHLQLQSELKRLQAFSQYGH